MGLVPCPLPCHTSTEESHEDHSNISNHLLQSEASTTTSSSLSSQPSLPSVLSLTTSISNQLQLVLEAPTTHHLCIATLKTQTSSSYVCSLALSGNFLYSGLSNGQIIAWSRLHPSSPNKVVATTNSTVKSLAVIGELLFSAHQDHKIRVWKIDINLITNPHGHQKHFKCIATLPTLKDRVPRFFSPKDYVQIRRHKKCTWVHHVDTVSALAISNDGSFLYSASWDRTFKIWRTSDFRCLESVSNAHDDAINAIASSRDGEFVYTGSADKKIKVWKKVNKSVVLDATLERHKSAVNALAFSSDGSVLYSGACDRSILVWERDSDHVRGVKGGGMVVVGALRGHSKAILCLAVVADLVFSGSADCNVRVWRRSGRLVDDDHNRSIGYSCLAVLEGHRKPVKCLTAACNNRSEDSDDSDDSGDSFLVYSGSLDCDIKVWQIHAPFF
ncbi:unnamed protein product [Prunus armeniaca]|uniref:Uncharacterized protein n=1 Tax=Prunus armeniaca TaxID=36596 RepID=A0A6J5TPT7_PRUAR|nr:unnamed protein product [Prunus armeniaca]